jgi:HAE1 family hydrophobic/amphiphilic exporter-1
MLVAIGLVYVLMVILFDSLLVPLVIFVALPLAVIGAFVSLAATGRALDLSALISLLRLRGIVGTTAIVLRDLAVVANAIVPYWYCASSPWATLPWLLRWTST